jgi:hypothetical protein
VLTRSGFMVRKFWQREKFFGGCESGYHFIAPTFLDLEVLVRSGLNLDHLRAAVAAASDHLAQGKLKLYSPENCSSYDVPALVPNSWLKPPDYIKLAGELSVFSE